jgi:translation elongation factor P/translation initiation factor 5A
MRVTIVPDDSCIIVDGEALQFSFAADSNIHAIQWYDTYGTIEYKSGPAEYFTDQSVVTPFGLAFETEKQRIADEATALEELNNILPA